MAGGAPGRIVVGVKPFLRKLLLLLCTIVVALMVSFLLTETIRRTGWYKERMLRMLLTGDAHQKLRAASTLAEVGAETQLLRAMREQDKTTHEMARRAVEHLWFFAAGKEAYEEMQAAYRAEEREDFRQALRLLDRLVTQHPEYAEAWNRRASVFWQMGEWEKSLADCERALRLNPNHYGALQGKGVCLIKKGNLTDACRALRASLKIAPHDPLTRKALSQCEELQRARPPEEKHGELL